MGAKRGRVTIDFADLEDLERIYRRIVGDSNPQDRTHPVDQPFDRDVHLRCNVEVYAQQWTSLWTTAMSIGSTCVSGIVER